MREVTVFIAHVNLRHRNNLFAAMTMEALEAKIAAYCKRTDALKVRVKFDTDTLYIAEE